MLIHVESHGLSIISIICWTSFESEHTDEIVATGLHTDPGLAIVLTTLP